MSKRLVLTILFLAISLLGCSRGGHAPAPVSTLPPSIAPPPPPVQAAAVAGTWFSRTDNNAVNCGIGEYIDAQTIVITQNDNAITLSMSTGNEFSGTVNGDIIEWTGNFEERGGTSTFTSLSTTVSGNSASGNATWTWTDGIDSCNGTMEIAASRDWGVEESLHNTRPSTADRFELTDDVAFITGTALTIDDKDYFLIELAADATVQAELSHFDLQTSDLDLEILDENLVQIALSNSVDEFEKVEAQMQAGVVYYIGVLPISTPSPVSYNLSIDVI